MKLEEKAASWLLDLQDGYVTNTCYFQIYFSLPQHCHCFAGLYLPDGGKRVSKSRRIRYASLLQQCDYWLPWSSIQDKRSSVLTAGLPTIAVLLRACSPPRNLSFKGVNVYSRI
jgi:hypothetical protein